MSYRRRERAALGSRALHGSGSTMSSRKMGLSKSGLVGSGRLPAAEAALQPREEAAYNEAVHRATVKPRGRRASDSLRMMSAGAGQAVIPPSAARRPGAHATSPGGDPDLTEPSLYGWEIGEPPLEASVLAEPSTLSSQGTDMHSSSRDARASNLLFGSSGQLRSPPRASSLRGSPIKGVGSDSPMRRRSSRGSARGALWTTPPSYGVSKQEVGYPAEFQAGGGKLWSGAPGSEEQSPSRRPENATLPQPKLLSLDDASSGQHLAATGPTGTPIPGTQAVRVRATTSHEHAAIGYRAETMPTGSLVGEERRSSSDTHFSGSAEATPVALKPSTIEAFRQIPALPDRTAMFSESKRAKATAADLYDEKATQSRLEQRRGEPTRVDLSNFVSKDSQTALHVASRLAQLDAATELATRGGMDAVLATDAKGNFPLHSAATNASDAAVAVIKMLCARGSPSDPKNNLEWTPLHYAAAAGNVASISTLLNLGAKATATTSQMTTPLHLAAATGNLEAIKVLIRAGADPNALDHLHKSPTFFAGRNNHNEAMALLARVRTRLLGNKRNIRAMLLLPTHVAVLAAARLKEKHRRKVVKKVGKVPAKTVPRVRAGQGTASQPTGRFVDASATKFLRPTSRGSSSSRPPSGLRGSSASGSVSSAAGFTDSITDGERHARADVRPETFGSATEERPSPARQATASRKAAAPPMSIHSWSRSLPGGSVRDARAAAADATIRYAQQPTVETSSLPMGGRNSQSKSPLGWAPTPEVDRLQDERARSLKLRAKEIADSAARVFDSEEYSEGLDGGAESKGWDRPDSRGSNTAALPPLGSARPASSASGIGYRGQFPASDAVVDEWAQQQRGVPVALGEDGGAEYAHDAALLPGPQEPSVRSLRPPHINEVQFRRGYRGEFTVDDYYNRSATSPSPDMLMTASDYQRMGLQVPPTVAQWEQDEEEMAEEEALMLGQLGKHSNRPHSSGEDYSRERRSRGGLLSEGDVHSGDPTDQTSAGAAAALVDDGEASALYPPVLVNAPDFVGTAAGEDKGGSAEHSDGRGAQGSDE